MKICVAQNRPVKGDIAQNIENHRKLIELAVANGAQLIVFPELSVTKYDSLAAKDWATDAEDARFDEFQRLSDERKLTIGVGVPTRSAAGTRISLIFFQPFAPPQTYSKQRLHEDEFPYFVPGDAEVTLEIDGHKIAPAICYESMFMDHAEKAVKNGADVYLASVAKTADGVERGARHYARVAEKYAMPVLMANCLGRCDDFESVGRSAAWNARGELAGELDDRSEGVLIFDTATGEAIARVL